MQHPSFTLGGGPSASTSRGASPTTDEPFSPTLSASASVSELSQQFDRQSLHPRRQTTSFERALSHLHDLDPSHLSARNRARTTPLNSTMQRNDSAHRQHHHAHGHTPRRKHSSARLQHVQRLVHQMLQNQDDEDALPSLHWSSPTSCDESIPSPTFSSDSSFSPIPSSSNLAGMHITEHGEASQRPHPAPALRKVDSRYKVAKELRIPADTEMLGNEDMRGLVRKEIRLRKMGRRERLRERR